MVVFSVKILIFVIFQVWSVERPYERPNRFHVGSIALVNHFDFVGQESGYGEKEDKVHEGLRKPRATVVVANRVNDESDDQHVVAVTKQEDKAESEDQKGW